MGVARGSIVQSENPARAPHGIIFLAPPTRLQRLFPVPRRGQWAGLLPRWTTLSSNGEPEPGCQFERTQLSQSIDGHAVAMLVTNLSLVLTFHTRNVKPASNGSLFVLYSFSFLSVLCVLNDLMIFCEDVK